jgi:signal transduction histidine kinase
VRGGESGLSAVGASRLDRVVQRLHQLDELLDGLLGLAPSAAPLRRGLVSLAELALAVLHQLRKAQPQRQVRCSVQPELWVVGDERLLGIALANLPFQRLHGHGFEGSGIGLALARRIIERHRGSIWAESPPSGGARFLFTLPGSMPAPGGPRP